MRRLTAWVLGVLGVMGILTALSLTIQKEQGHFLFQMGFPDSWLLWEEDDQKGFRWEMNLIRWSVAILVLGVICLKYALRLGSRNTARSSP
jgi:hypothetical protein